MGQVTTELQRRAEQMRLRAADNFLFLFSSVEVTGQTMLKVSFSRVREWNPILLGVPLNGYILFAVQSWIIQ